MSEYYHTQKEFERLQITCQSEGAKLPTKRQLEKKIEELKKFVDRPVTEVCLTKHLYSEISN